jgi:hypothetical protein
MVAVMLSLFWGGETCVMLELRELVGLGVETLGMETMAMWSGNHWDVSHAVLWMMVLHYHGQLSVSGLLRMQLSVSQTHCCQTSYRHCNTIWHTSTRAARSIAPGTRWGPYDGNSDCRRCKIEFADASEDDGVQEAEIVAEDWI